MIVVEYFSNLLFGKMIIFFTDFVFRHPLPLVRELCYIVMVMWWWWWQRQRTVQSHQTLVCSRFSFNFCIHSHTDPQSRCHGNNFISTFKKAPKQSTLWCSSETSFLWRENNNTFTVRRTDLCWSALLLCAKQATIHPPDQRNYGNKWTTIFPEFQKLSSADDPFAV